MLRAERQSPPAANRGASNVTGKGDASTLPRSADVLADLDALAEHLRGRYAVQVTVNDAGDRRTFLYRNAGAAERCVQRARERGRDSHVTLVQLLPVGVVSSLGGAR